MKKDNSDKIWLESILEHIEALESFCANLSYEEFQGDMKTRFACEKCIQNISEASDNLTKEFKLEFKEFPWVQIKGMRNILVHEYFRIDYRIVWDAIQNFVPTLKSQVREVLNSYLL
ncbi:MAG: DUF86 domain-containing protein [Leptospiraceae bacterium]|nr:DUF86 domain-containing protein [Leptospiraceae bacterium]